MVGFAAGSPAPPPRSKQRARKERRDLAQLLVQSDPIHLPIYEPLSQPPGHGAHRSSAPLVTARRSGNDGSLLPGRSQEGLLKAQALQVSRNTGSARKPIQEESFNKQALFLLSTTL